jgi:hypothetical protein
MERERRPLSNVQVGCRLLEKQQYDELTQSIKHTDCTATSFYKSPIAGSTPSLNDGLDILWDNSCIGQPRAVDISLISFGTPTNQSLIHQWANVDFSKGQYTVSIRPSPPFRRLMDPWHLPPASHTIGPNQPRLVPEQAEHQTPAFYRRFWDTEFPPNWSSRGSDLHRNIQRFCWYPIGSRLDTPRR